MLKLIFSHVSHAMIETLIHTTDLFWVCRLVANGVHSRVWRLGEWYLVVV